MDLTILVGTMTGTAELVAEEVSDELIEAGHGVEVLAMDDLDAAVFEPGRVFLICSSTYGQGDVPDNAMKMFEDLRQRRPDLSGMRYGVIGLGDRTYADTFCEGGRRFDRMLRELKAERVGEMLEHDASAGTVPEEEAIAWVREWIKKLSAAEAA